MTINSLYYQRRILPFAKMDSEFLVQIDRFFNRSELILKRKLKKALIPQNFTLISLWVHHFVSK